MCALLGKEWKSNQTLFFFLFPVCNTDLICKLIHLFLFAASYTLVIVCKLWFSVSTTENNGKVIAIFLFSVYVHRTVLMSVMTASVKSRLRFYCGMHSEVQEWRDSYYYKASWSFFFMCLPHLAFTMSLQPMAQCVLELHAWPWTSTERTQFNTLVQVWRLHCISSQVCTIWVGHCT